MRTHVDPTQTERLKALGIALRRVFSAEPAKVPEAIKTRLRALKAQENGDSAPQN